MIDPRMTKLADLLVTYSTKVQPGERVLIDAYDMPAEMVSLLINRVAEAGGLPFVDTNQSAVLRSLYMNATDEQMEILGRVQLEFMKEMQVLHRPARLAQHHRAVRRARRADADLPGALPEARPDYRVNNTKWVVLRWPTPVHGAARRA